jgi:acetyltransferase EpsM
MLRVMHDAEGDPGARPAPGPILFLVPARGGSVRVPGKNLRLVGGLPLVARAIRVAQAAAAELAGGPHRVVCSTDDPEIASVATAWGAEVLDRPAELATPTATSPDVALHALNALEARDGVRFGTVALVQATSPLAEPTDLVDAARHHRATGVSVTSVVTTHPAAWHKGMDMDGVLSAVAPADGQDVLLAGAFYVVAPAQLRATGRLVNPGSTIGWPIPAQRAVDVDTEQDLIVAEAILAGREATGRRRLVLVGGGQHARVVAEAARAGTAWDVVGYTDPEGANDAMTRLGIPFLGADDTAAADDDAWGVIGFGGTLHARRRAVERLGTAVRWATVVHPDAWVSPTATLEPGVVVMADAVINSEAVVGRHAIVNSGAIVEHDVRVGAFAHVAPGAVIGGGATIGEAAMIGLGAAIRDHVTVGEGSVVGMGGVVVRDVPDGGTVVGVPARAHTRPARPAG